MSQNKRKILVARDSMLNNIHEKGLSKQHTVKITNFPGAATKTVVEKLENLLKSKLDVHDGTNDLPKNINCLNNLREVHRNYLEI